jgi:NAD(P)-dependent dehydrogenase (short-subunit alcohol dehydrogenase family)
MTSSKPLAGQTVAVLGGTSGIGLETARQAKDLGADLVITGRNPDRLMDAAGQLKPVETAAFDATDHEALAAFFGSRSEPLGHVMVTAAGPYYAPSTAIDLKGVTAAFHERVGVMIDIAQLAGPAIRPSGSLTLMSGATIRQPTVGIAVLSAVSSWASAAAVSLAAELAPARVNMISPGFVDTPLSAEMLGTGLVARRQRLAEQLPIKRVMQPGDVAALAIHVMVNTAITGVTLNIDGGQQLIAGL